MNILFLYISFISSIFFNVNPHLTINITNIESLRGDIVIGVFNTEKDFLKDNTAIKNYTIKIDENSEQIVIKDLPKGEYAISLYHDKNSDNECNLNFLGIPKEPYGFSNNIKPKFSAPTFKECKISLTTNRQIEIKLIDWIP